MVVQKMDYASFLSLNKNEAKIPRMQALPSRDGDIIWRQCLLSDQGMEPKYQGPASTAPTNSSNRDSTYWYFAPSSVHQITT